MSKLFYCKRLINISEEIIQEYKPMNEEEFIQFSRQFIDYEDFNTDKYPYVFFDEGHFMDDLDYIKERNEEEWLLGHNPANDLGFEILIVEYK